MEAFATQGVMVEFEYGPWKRAYIETRESKVDGTSPWFPSEQKKQEAIIAEEPLLEEKEALFYRVDKDFDWTSIDDLKNTMWVVLLATHM